MNQDWVIEARGLTMRYDRGPEVISNLDLRVPRGAVFGLLGRNGVGKTTLIRLIMGLYRPVAGTVRVFGAPSQTLPMDVRQRIGYLSQDQRMFDWMNVDQLVDFTRAFYPTWDMGYSRELMQNLGLPRDVPLGQLSRGEQQKAGLLLALAPRPDLLVLDEPAANLDTVLRREFLESVLEMLVDHGMTVLISSHILTDVERIADHVGILAGGRLQLAAPLDALKESVKRLRLVFPGDAPDTVEVPGTVNVRRRERELLVTVKDFTPRVLDEIHQRYGVRADVQGLDLEELFIEFVRERG